MNTISNLRRWMKSVAPGSRNERIFSAMTIVDAVGTGALFSTAVLYYTTVAHFTASQVGVALTIASAIALLAPVPLGSLGDRVGHREIVVILCIARGVLYLLLLAAHRLQALVVLLSLIELCDVGATPSRRAYLADLVGAERRVPVNAYNRAVFNLGLSLGALLAIVSLASGGATRLGSLLVVNGVSYFVAGLAFMTLPSRRSVKIAVAATVNPGRSFPTKYLGMSLLAGVLLLEGDVLSVGLPLWIVNNTHAPISFAAVLLVVNTVVIVLFQVPISKRIRDLFSAGRAAVLTGAMLGSACALCSFSASMAGAPACLVLVAVVLLLSLGESCGAASGWTLSYELADPRRQGQYQGIWSFGNSTAGVGGPALMTALVVGLGVPGWYLLGLLFIIAFAAQGLSVLSGYVAPPSCETGLRPVVDDAPGRESSFLAEQV